MSKLRPAPCLTAPGALYVTSLLISIAGRRQCTRRRLATTLHRCSFPCRHLRQTPATSPRRLRPGQPGSPVRERWIRWTTWSRSWNNWRTTIDGLERQQVRGGETGHQAGHQAAIRGSPGERPFRSTLPTRTLIAPYQLPSARLCSDLNNSERTLHKSARQPGDPPLTRQGQMSWHRAGLPFTTSPLLQFHVALSSFVVHDALGSLCLSYIHLHPSCAQATPQCVSPPSPYSSSPSFGGLLPLRFQAGPPQS